MNDKKALVSVIIPIHNAEEYLLDTIMSVINQSYKNIEVILVDDGSEDNSLKIAKKYESSTFKVISQSNQGACAARNLGIEYSKGEWLQFLDADDILHYDKISNQIKAVYANPNEIKLVSAAWAHFINSPEDSLFKKGITWKNYLKNVDWLLDSWTKGGMMQTACWLANKSLIQKTGWWNEELLKNQDGEYFCRMILNTSNIIFVENAKVYYRKPSKDNVSQRLDSNSIESLLNSYIIYEQELLKKENSARVRKALARNYLKFIYQIHPSEPELLSKAYSKIENLNCNYKDLNVGGQRFKRLSGIIGFRNALKLRSMINIKF